MIQREDSVNKKGGDEMSRKIMALTMALAIVAVVAFAVTSVAYAAGPPSTAGDGICDGTCNCTCDGTCDCTCNCTCDGTGDGVKHQNGNETARQLRMGKYRD